MIALVSITAQFRGAEAVKNPPFGLLYIGSSLKKSGFDVEIFHITESQMRETVERIVRLNPIAVGFSVFTGIQTKLSADMSRMIKARSSIPIIWGGIHPSLIPEQCIREDYIDIVVVGEGEITFVELAEHIKKNKGLDIKTLKHIQGIAFKAASDYVITAPRPKIENLDDYKIDWSLIDLGKYIYKVKHWGGKKLLYYITSRGCPYGCTFCYNLKFNPNRTWRAHSTGHVIKEINSFKDQYGIEAITFHDDNFFANPKRAFEILDAIQLNWWGEARISSINEKFAERLVQSKCHSLFFGWESGSDRILKLMNKDLTVDQTFNAVKILSKYPQISVSGMAIIGVPTETWAEIKTTIDTAIKLSDIHPNLVLNLATFLPFPGTPMYEFAKKEGFVPPARTEDWANFDSKAGTIEPTWIKWRTGNTRKLLNTIGRCAPHLNNTPYGNWWQSAAKDVLHFMEEQRLRHKFFSLPIELDVFAWYYKKYIEKDLLD
jgi:anaerobic magnesium-protoporphyrin IX monomethyl ester cyclase